MIQPLLFPKGDFSSQKWLWEEETKSRFSYQRQHSRHLLAEMVLSKRSSFMFKKEPKFLNTYLIPLVIMVIPLGIWSTSTLFFPVPSVYLYIGYVLILALEQFLYLRYIDRRYLSKQPPSSWILSQCTSDMLDFSSGGRVVEPEPTAMQLDDSVAEIQAQREFHRLAFLLFPRPVKWMKQVCLFSCTVTTKHTSMC